MISDSFIGDIRKILFQMLLWFISDAGMKLIDAVDWDEVKETAKFYYTDSTTTLNLYPALIISLLLLFCKLQQTVAKRL